MQRTRVLIRAPYRNIDSDRGGGSVQLIINSHPLRDTLQEIRCKANERQGFVIDIQFFVIELMRHRVSESE
jgi:hypothetical protein